MKLKVLSFKSSPNPTPFQVTAAMLGEEVVYDGEEEGNYT